MTRQEDEDRAAIRLAHRAEALRRRPGPRSSKPDCAVIGHAWVAEDGREGTLICLSCGVVRPH